LTIVVKRPLLTTVAVLVTGPAMAMPPLLAVNNVKVKS
jgi:hypothetical protein